MLGTGRQYLCFLLDWWTSPSVFQTTGPTWTDTPTCSSKKKWHIEKYVMEHEFLELRRPYPEYRISLTRYSGSLGVKARGC